MPDSRVWPKPSGDFLNADSQPVNPMVPSTPLRHYSLLPGVVAILCWCWSGVCFRKGSDLMGSSMVYLAFMTGCGSLTAVVLQILRGHSVIDMVRLPLKVVVAGFFGVALYTILLAAAFGMAAETDIGQINLLNYLWPVWMVILGVALLGRRPRVPVALAGILTGLAGVAMSRGFDGFGHWPARLTPHAFALAGGFLWALYAVLLRKWKIPEAQGGTAFHFAVCAVIAGLLARFGGGWRQVPPWSGDMLFWILLGGIGPVGIAYSLYEISIKNGPVLLLAALAYFIPIGSSLLIGFFYRDAWNPGLLLGAGLIAVGAWLVRQSCREDE
jgi:drug/metabolite transporter (DMT)-like permease